MKKALLIIVIGIALFFTAEVGYQMFSDSSIFEGSIVDSTIKYGEKVEEASGVKYTKGNFFSNFLPRLISLSLQIFGSVMLVMIVISGIYLVMGGLDENMIQEAKKMFYYSIVGAVIITISFAIVYGITQINWTAVT